MKILETINDFISTYDFNYKTNHEAYDDYLKTDGEHYSLIGFSQYVVANSKYKIINKTIKNKKYRLFVEK